MPEVSAPRSQKVSGKRLQTDSELDDFLAAQNAGFEDGRAYFKARRQQPRKQS
jgi:predicted alpha/beta-fold hydrolase